MTLRETIQYSINDLSCKLEGFGHLIANFSPELHEDALSHRNKFIGIGEMIKTLSNEAGRIAILVDLSEGVDPELEIETENYEFDPIGLAIASVRLARNKVG